MIQHLNNRFLVWAMFAAVVSTIASARQVVLGPEYNPANGSRYYVVQAANWTAARSFAVARGGDLASISDPAENEFIRARLAAASNQKLFLGLNDAATEGQLKWSDGTPVTYTNFSGNSNTSTNDYAFIEPTLGQWSMGTASQVQYAVVEHSGPLLVPEEFENFSQAVVHAGTMSDEIVLGAGAITLGPGENFLSPTGHTVKVRGRGHGVTFLNGPDDSEQLADFFGSWEFHDLTFRRLLSSTTHPNMAQGSFLLRRCGFESVETGLMPMAAVQAASARFENCRFTSGGSPLLITTNYPQPVTLTNCGLVTEGVTALMASSREVSLTNCTVVAMQPDTNDYVFEGTADYVLANCIVKSGGQPVIGFGTALDATFSVIPGGWPGTGNISADPMLTSSTDLRLLPGSPCIDAGDADAYTGRLSDVYGEPRFWDDPTTPNQGSAEAIDIGCSEFQSESCPADFDGTGFVDTDDFTAFVLSFEAGC
ncbi:MAG: hypothetical protein GIKADHBN_01919 [Phycisphaerales bacterium]|nr:hypothetical protein [Phycisphaerales bacterium]